MTQGEKGEGIADVISERGKLASFTNLLSETYAQEYADEASLGERFRMMSFHLIMMGTIFIMLFIITQWLLGQVIAASMAPPLTASQAMSRMFTVNAVAFTIASLSIAILGLISKTPFTYMVFNARVVNEHTLGEITRRQAVSRFVIKTVTFFITPLAMLYFINHRGANVVDRWTGTRVVIFRKTLVIDDGAGEPEPPSQQ